MSGSQKVLRVFGILDLLIAGGNALAAFRGGGASSWVNAGIALVAAVLLLGASVNARLINGAWLIILVDLVLSIGELILNVIGNRDRITIIGAIVAIILNLIVFLAASNVKRQAKKQE